jgi:hypothetical protein
MPVQPDESNVRGERMHPSRALLACLIVLYACDSGSPSKQAGSSQTRIFDTQRNALDKAKAVQDTLHQAAEQQRRQEEQ